MDLHTIFQSQYHATLKMLEQAIKRCLPEIWDDPQDRNRFWHLAYHALFFTHLYLSTRGEDFVPWERHREEYELMGPKPWPPHDLPKIGDPYTKEDLLAYCQVCHDFVDQQAPTLNWEAASGFDWLSFNKLELQIYNIRHLQQHTGELMERLGSRAEIDIDWVTKA